ncbi:MAG: hypothetical protein DBW67_04735 [SAR116 cluster bacterium]|nr:MAG: hypothetical protein DBW67_04735 [SAR116 cluster bacterium]HBQ22134.1 hypothetical protein [Alphaproteobacteria bacterium]HCJ61326.1 hypothetical protein [Alphaproteobacteria bacterium]
MGACMKLQANGFSYRGEGILLTGPSGIGKTGLMLEMIRSGGQLVGDDAVVLHNQSGSLFMTPPDATKGLVELRGVGVIRLEPAEKILVTMHLCLGHKISERLPNAQQVSWLGVGLPSYFLLMDQFAPARLHALVEGQLQAY